MSVERHGSRGSQPHGVRDGMADLAMKRTPTDYYVTLNTPECPCHNYCFVKEPETRYG